MRIEEGDIPFLDVPRETRTRLFYYARLLAQWNEAINLIGPQEDIWQRHIIDSAQLFPLLPSPDITMADLGSGAGLPGMVLAILGVRDVHLIEKDQRKIAFLREASRITETPVTLHATAVETSSLPLCGAITARALAPLERLLGLAQKHVQPDTFCLFPKGKNWYKEIETAQARWRFSYTSHRSVTDGDAAILLIRHVERIKP